MAEDYRRNGNDILSYSRGFTLIELSIVLIIIGLIVGGIVGGQSLVKQSELKSVVSDIQSFKIALNSFRLEFNALPGDLINAAEYWPTTCGGGGGSPNPVCDGDGDGEIEYLSVLLNDRETLEAWEHLSLSGILPGEFGGALAGVVAGPLYVAIIGITVPGSKLKGGGYSFETNPALVTAVPDGLYVSYGAPTGVSGTAAPFMETKDAVSIDKKIDDGVAKVGQVLTDTFAPAVADSCTASVAPFDYVLSATGQNCTMWFRMD